MSFFPSHFGCSVLCTREASGLSAPSASEKAQMASGPQQYPRSREKGNLEDLVLLVDGPIAGSLELVIEKQLG